MVGLEFLFTTLNGSKPDICQSTALLKVASIFVQMYILQGDYLLGKMGLKKQLNLFSEIKMFYYNLCDNETRTKTNLFCHQKGSHEKMTLKFD